MPTYEAVYEDWVNELVLTCDIGPQSRFDDEPPEGESQEENLLDDESERLAFKEGCLVKLRRYYQQLKSRSPQKSCRADVVIVEEDPDATRIHVDVDSDEEYMNALRLFNEVEADMSDMDSDEEYTNALRLFNEVETALDAENVKKGPTEMQIPSEHVIKNPITAENDLQNDSEVSTRADFESVPAELNAHLKLESNMETESGQSGESKRSWKGQDTEDPRATKSFNWSTDIALRVQMPSAEAGEMEMKTIDSKSIVEQIQSKQVVGSPAGGVEDQRLQKCEMERQKRRELEMRRHARQRERELWKESRRLQKEHQMKVRHKPAADRSTSNFNPHQHAAGGHTAKQNLHEYDEKRKARQEREQARRLLKGQKPQKEHQPTTLGARTNASDKLQQKNSELFELQSQLLTTPRSQRKSLKSRIEVLDREVKALSEALAPGGGVAN